MENCCVGFWSKTLKILVFEQLKQVTAEAERPYAEQPSLCYWIFQKRSYATDVPCHLILQKEKY